MLTAQDYRNAALLRLEEAHLLLIHGYWPGAIYLAGRAVESMFRALLRLETLENTSGHDLRDLLKSLVQLDILTDRDEQVMLDEINNVAIVWHNNLRFYDDNLLLRMLKQGRLDRKIKGSPLKFWATRVIQSSETIVTRGDVAWNHCRTK